MKQQYIGSDEMVLNEEEFDLKKWTFRMLRVWPWFLLSIIICLAAAWMYLRYTNPVYEAVASVMVKDEKKGGTLMNNTVLNEMGLGSSSKLVENEIEILKSYDLMESVVNKLQLYVAVIRPGRIRDISVFDKQSPFTIEIINPQEIKTSINWIIQPGKDFYFFQNLKNINSKSLEYGKVYETGSIRFRCMPNTFFIGDRMKKDSTTTTYQVDLNPLNNVTLNYGKKLLVEPVSKTASVINLKIKDINETRAVSILQTLIDIYNRQGLEDKNRVTENTIDFLNGRLVSVSKELSGVEGAVEQFKSENKITDISADAQLYLSMAQQIDIQKAQSETQMNIISALERDLVLNQENPQLMPSTLGIQEPSMAALIERHNELVLQKQRIVQKSGPQNPLLIDLQDQIKEIRSKLLSNVRSLKEAYDISLTDISRKDEQLNARIRNVPLMEKKLVQIKRDQNVQEQLYAFLLQKREESALTLASTIEDSRTIVKARSLDKVSPKKMIIWAIAGLLSLLLPVGIITIIDFLNNRIGDSAQVREKTNITILGSISHVRKFTGPIVIDNLSRSVAAEQIRNIRTGISFSGKGKTVKTILITSFQPGDGKSFVSLNLAASCALLNKRTVLLEFDLRKPGISKMLNIAPTDGLSSILTGKSQPSELLMEIPGYMENLYILPAGYLPPNPVELISGKHMDCMIKTLQEQFEYIIIDTPPFSVVTDATLLRQFADITIVVLRQSYTSKDVYQELKMYKERHPDYPIYLLLNDVGKRKRYQNGYASYGKDYYRD